MKTKPTKLTAFVVAVIMLFAFLQIAPLKAIAAETNELTFSGALQSKDDVQTYKFELTTDAKVSLTFKHEYIDWGNRDMWVIQLLSSSGKIYEFGSNSDQTEVSSLDMFLSAGTYTLRISAAYYLGIAFEHDYIGSPIRDYTAIVKYKENSGDFEKEPNNTQKDSTPIQLNKPVVGALQCLGDPKGSVSASKTDDIDYYSFELSVPSKVSVKFEYEYADWGSRDIFSISLISPSSKLLTMKAMATEMVAQSDVFDLPAGKYYVEVKGGGYFKFPHTSLPYTLTVISDTPQSAVPQVSTLIAKPTASTVLVNGKQVAFDAYSINGNNYFKLRDLAYALNGSGKQFDVGWDGANNAISLTSGKAYAVVGGEMTSKGAGDKTPTATTSKIYLDGKEVSFTAYVIEGNNYFKLRDIGLAFDFGVTWDGAKNTIVIDTSIGYTPE